MIEGIEKAFQDLKSIEDNLDTMRSANAGLRFDNEQLRKDTERLRKDNEDLRRLLATAVETIQRLKAEEGESPHV